MKPSRRRTKLFCIVTLLSFSALGPSAPNTSAQVAAADAMRPQGDSGIVTGRVRNSATNDYLGNAYVHVEGTSIHGLTDRDGSFSLPVPIGSQTVVVDYTGLASARLPVDVKAGVTTNQDVALTSDVYTLGKFVVKGISEGNALALQSQRYSPVPKTVVAVDAYGAPTGNPGELLQRIPGISTNITQGEITSIYVRGMNVGFAGLLVNGDPVAVSLGALVGSSGQYTISELATSNLSEVELIKAPTPDQDANAIAGHVNLVTKRSFDRGGRETTLNLSTSSTVRDWSGSPVDTNFRNLDRISLSYADVFSIGGGQKNLGVTVDLAELAVVRVSDEVGPQPVNSLTGAYTNFASANPLTNTFSVQEAGGTERKKTVGINIDYKLGKDEYVFAKYAWTNMSRHIPAFYSYVVPTGVSDSSIFAPGSTYANSTVLPGLATASTRSLNSVRVSTTYQFSGGSETKLFDRTATLSIRGNYSHALSYNPYFVNAQANDPGVGFNINRDTSDGQFYPRFTQTAGPDITNPSSYVLATVGKTSTKGAPETVSGLRADFKKEYNTAAPTFIKIGVKLADDKRSDQRFYDTETFIGAKGIPNDPSNTMVPYVGYQFKMTKAGYGPFPFLPLITNKESLAPAGYFTKTAAQAYNDVLGFDSRPLDIDERYTSAYIEGNIDLGKLRVLAGIRTEKTDDTSHAWILNQTAAYGGNSIGGSSIDPAVVAANVARANHAFVGVQQGTNKYTNAFPGVHFIYEPVDGLLARFSYNKSISRPDIASILPTVSADDVNQIITVGNPNLKPYFSDNFDLSVEKYFSPAGLVSIGVFQKQISHYYRSFSTIVGPAGYNGNGQYIGYTENIALNVGDARIRGVEFSYQQQFSFLPGFLKGFAAFANYTYLQAQGTFGTLVNFGALAISPRVPFLTPRTLNVGLSYTGYGLEARVMANHQSQTYQGSSGIDYDAASRTWVDLKVRYAFSPRYGVEVNVSNLTNSYENKFISSNGRLAFGMLKPGTAYSVGMTARF